MAVEAAEERTTDDAQWVADPGSNGVNANEERNLQQGAEEPVDEGEDHLPL